MPVTPLPSGSILPSVTTQPSVAGIAVGDGQPFARPPGRGSRVVRPGRPKEDVPSKALIPPGMKLSNRWMTETMPARSSWWRTSSRPAIRSSRPEVSSSGVGTRGRVPPWTPVFGIEHAQERGDPRRSKRSSATRPETDPIDLLLQESTGGSGACGNWRVIDLAAATERWVRVTLRWAGRPACRSRRHRAPRGRLRSRRSPLLSERVPNDRPGLSRGPRIREGQRAVHARLRRASPTSLSED